MYTLGAILLEDAETAGFRQIMTSPPVRAAIAVGLAITLMFAAAGAYYGRNIITRGAALTKVERSQADGENRLVFWLPPNSGISVVFDPYAGKYDDAVLNDLREARGLRSTLGAWIITGVAKPRRASLAPFLTETTGKLTYVDAVTGKVILNTVH